MLLHQRIPHLHHEHQKDHDHGVAESTHSHEHKHEKETEDPKDFFSILMSMHSHGGNSSEVPVVKNSYQYVFLKKARTDNPSAENDVIRNAFLEGTVVVSIQNYQPPPEYFGPYLSYPSLRGPPRLV